MHRDIKPNNILLFGDSDHPNQMNAKLSDFGSGVINNETIQTTGQ